MLSVPKKSCQRSPATEALRNNFVFRLKGHWGHRENAWCGRAGLCLFSQFHGLVGSTERHVLAPSPTELHSLHFCPTLALLPPEVDRAKSLVTACNGRAQPGELGLTTFLLITARRKFSSGQSFKIRWNRIFSFAGKNQSMRKKKSCHL